MHELKSIIRQIKAIQGLPRLPTGIHAHDMVNEGDEEDKLVALNCMTRFFIWMLMLLPKLIIIAALFMEGCIWLAATESFADLILNSLALTFVLDIDSVIFTCFLPERMAKNLARMK